MIVYYVNSKEGVVIKLEECKLINEKETCYIIKALMGFHPDKRFFKAGNFINEMSSNEKIQYLSSLVKKGNFIAEENYESPKCRKMREEYSIEMFYYLSYLAQNDRFGDEFVNSDIAMIALISSTLMTNGHLEDYSTRKKSDTNAAIKNMFLALNHFVKNLLCEEYYDFARKYGIMLKNKNISSHSKKLAWSYFVKQLEDKSRDFAPHNIEIVVDDDFFEKKKKQKGKNRLKQY